MQRVDEFLGIIYHKYGYIKDSSASESWEWQNLILNLVPLLKVCTEHFKHNYSFLLQDVYKPALTEISY